MFEKNKNHRKAILTQGCNGAIFYEGRGQLYTLRSPMAYHKTYKRISVPFHMFFLP